LDIKIAHAVYPVNRGKFAAEGFLKNSDLFSPFPDQKQNFCAKFGPTLKFYKPRKFELSLTLTAHDLQQVIVAIL